jgi:hypothetical protein
MIVVKENPSNEEQSAYLIVVQALAEGKFLVTYIQFDILQRRENKKGGAGKGNWGNISDEGQNAEEEKPTAESQEGKETETQEAAEGQNQTESESKEQVEEEETKVTHSLAMLMWIWY